MLVQHRTHRCQFSETSNLHFISVFSKSIHPTFGAWGIYEIWEIRGTIDDYKGVTLRVRYRKNQYAAWEWFRFGKYATYWSFRWNIGVVRYGQVYENVQYLWIFSALLHTIIKFLRIPFALSLPLKNSGGDYTSRLFHFNTLDWAIITKSSMFADVCHVRESD